MAGTHEEQAAILRNLFGNDIAAASAADIGMLPRPFEVTDAVSYLLDDAVLDKIRDFVQDPETYVEGIADAGLRNKLLQLRSGPTLEVQGTGTETSSGEPPDDSEEGGVVEGGQPPTSAANRSGNSRDGTVDQDDRGGRGQRDRGERQREAQPPPAPVIQRDALVDIDALFARYKQPESDPKPVPEAAEEVREDESEPDSASTHPASDQHVVAKKDEHASGGLWSKFKTGVAIGLLIVICGGIPVWIWDTIMSL